MSVNAVAVCNHVQNVNVIFALIKLNLNGNCFNLHGVETV